MLYHAQSFLQYVVYSVYEAEESQLRKQVAFDSIADVPPDARITVSHTIHEIRIDETNSLRPRTAPHGNESSLKNKKKSDCAMCSPVGIRIVLAIAATRQWPLIKADVRPAFVGTGKDERHFYVRPPCESREKKAQMAPTCCSLWPR